MPHELQEEEPEDEEEDDEPDTYAKLSELADALLPPSQDENEEQPEQASAVFASNEKVNASTTIPNTAAADFKYEYSIDFSPSHEKRDRPAPRIPEDSIYLTN